MLWPDLNLVSFSLNGLRFGLDARYCRGAELDRPQPASDTAANAHPSPLWVADLIGGPVANLPPPPPRARHVLRLIVPNTTPASRAIIVPAPVEWSVVNGASIYPAPPLLAARSQLCGLSALVWEQGPIQLILEPGPWFDAP